MTHHDLRCERRRVLPQLRPDYARVHGGRHDALVAVTARYLVGEHDIAELALAVQHVRVHLPPLRPILKGGKIEVGYAVMSSGARVDDAHTPLWCCFGRLEDGGEQQFGKVEVTYREDKMRSSYESQRTSSPKTLVPN
jgi:hypothetical protein